MYPFFWGYQTLFVVWSIAIVVGFLLATLAAQRDGHGGARSFFALCLVAVVFVAGTKIHFALANDPLARALTRHNLLVDGFHFPGGLLATLLIVPPLLWLLGIRPLAFGDSTVPVFALAIGIARLGCFANGCCFGYVSEAPWALSFPIGSRAYAVHVATGVISPADLVSRPVLPLMLLFSAVGFALAGILWFWRGHRRFTGEITLGFVALWSSANVAIEWGRDPAMLRGTPHLFEASIVIAAIAVPTLVLLRIVRRRTRLPAPSSPQHPALGAT